MWSDLYLTGLDRAFRHGDIENILSQLAKTVGGAGGGGGLLGLAETMLNAAAGGDGSKFTKGDIKKVYFVRIFAPVQVASH